MVSQTDRTWKAAIASIILFTTVLLFMVRSIPPKPAQAQTTLLNSKVAQLEFTVQRLQTRVNQLENQRPQVLSSSPHLNAQSSAQSDTQSSAQPRPQSRQGSSSSAVSREEFSNLATLVIELRQDVDRLLEQQ